VASQLETQVPPVQVEQASQTETQVPFWQVEQASQALPQVPQLLISELVSMQVLPPHRAPLQQSASEPAWSPAGTQPVHSLVVWSQTWPLGQSVSIVQVQVPQLPPQPSSPHVLPVQSGVQHCPLSVRQTWPLGQVETQVLLWQVWQLAQKLLQPPQLLLSEVVSRQKPKHSVSPLQQSAPEPAMPPAPMQPGTHSSELSSQT
jgi:hypothetical protein